MPYTIQIGTGFERATRNVSRSCMVASMRSWFQPGFSHKSQTASATGIFHADTTMTEIAARFGEQLLCRRSVQVDIVGIGKLEFDKAQAVFLAGSWPEKELAVSQPCKRFFGRRRFLDAASARIDNVIGIVRQIRGVLFDLRNEFIALNFERHILRRTEEYGFYLALEHRRCVVVGSADNDVHRRNDVMLFVANM